MKILIDINHPAHVHYFRNFIKMMEAKGHQFCVINRNSQMINQLLDIYGIEHTIRNKRPEKKSTLVSLIYLMKMALWCFYKSLAFHPDMYMGFGSPACSITSRIFGKPCVLLSDTEHNKMNQRIIVPTASTIITPFYFQKRLGPKQRYYNGYTEQLYLHSKYYQPDIGILDELNVKPKEYVIVRYIAYDAHHDLTTRPLSEDYKKQIVTELAKHYKVFISLEKSVTDSFYDEYVLRISPERIHDLEAYAKFMVTEGATMASESFILGVPYLYLNPLKCGNIDYQCKNYSNRAFQTTDGDKALAIIKQFMTIECDSATEKAIVETQTICPTESLLGYIENYPTSKSESNLFYKQ